jgi:hypothetical protein
MQFKINIYTCHFEINEDGNDFTQTHRELSEAGETQEYETLDEATPVIREVGLNNQTDITEKIASALANGEKQFSIHLKFVE